MGSDVLLQPSTLQADNHKKRTGFGPQQASFGVYVSNAFGGMSGALKLDGILKGVDALQQENTVGAKQLRSHEDQLQDHSLRIKKLELSPRT